MQPSIINEFSLIRKISQKIPTNSNDIIKGIGDDSAVIKIAKNKYLLATCDTQVEGVHFLPKIAKPEQVGQKAIAVNVSDIAAMGGKPTFCLVSLIIPQKTSVNYIDRLYNGIILGCKNYSVQIVGGNISRGKEIVIDIFMLGEVKPNQLLLRSKAKPGDKILVTGTLGEAGAGLELLLNPKLSVKKKVSTKLISRQLTPKARLLESGVIAKTRMATSMIDISDGLESDVSHLCEQSKVGIKLYEDLLPISDSVFSVAKLINKSSLELALEGGEDYELLFTTPPDFVAEVIKAVKQKTGTKVSIVGEILSRKEGRWLILKDGRKVPLKAGGWDHFRSRRLEARLLK